MADTLNSKARTARAFVPGHITGIFRIFDEYEDPLNRGSRGAGFSVAAGTVTEVRMVEHDTLDITTEYNDRIIDAPVTSTVIRKLSEDFGRTFKVHVRHDSSLPIGVGFGASGAGALGTSIALCHLLDESIEVTKAAQYAHYSEIVNHAGLGDVLAQIVGGFEIRTQPGAPGIGKTVSISEEETSVVLAGAPGLETRDVLTNPDSRKLINESGDRLIDLIISNPIIGQFIESSRQFAESIGLMTSRVENALSDLSAIDLHNSSMVMIGDSVFCLCDSTSQDNAIDILSKYWKPSEILVTAISQNGGGL
ncbi:MAG: pantoate kinase, partial [Candidatus Thorarchaeota archaeon]